jgi:hypothetical protein
MDREQALEIFNTKPFPMAYLELFGRPHWADVLRVIPEYMHHGIVAYILFGDRPGDFLSAVISNDLIGAIKGADAVNAGKLPEYVRFFYNDTPGECWGSEELMEEWIKRGGLYPRSKK